MPITYPSTQLAGKVEVLLAGVWTDISTYVLWKNKVRVDRGQGIEDKSGFGRPNPIRLTLDNTDGRFSPRNVTGPYFGKLRVYTQLRVSYDAGTGYVQRGLGEIPTWNVKRPPNDVHTVTIEAVDPRRRLQQGALPLNSPIYNSMIAVEPEVYAPLEESSDATAVSLANTSGMVSSSGVINFGSDTTLPGSKSAVVLTGNSYIALRPTGGTFDGKWQTDFFMKIPAAPAATTVVKRTYTTGTAARFDFSVSPASYRIQAFDSASTSIIDTGAVALTGVYLGQWMHVRLMAQNTSTTQYQWAFVTFPLSGSGSALGGSGLTGQVGQPIVDGIIPQVGNEGTAVAHWTILNEYNFSAVDESGDGYSGESPTARYLRLCAEQGVDATVRSNGTDGVRMGVQRSLDFVSNITECLTANEGFLDTDTDGNLRMTSRTYIENRTVAMTVDHSLRRAQDMVAAETDRLLMNDFTADRASGGRINVKATTGPLNSNDPNDDPDGVGRVPDSDNYNLDSDAALPDHASYRVSQGTIDHPALENLTIHFGRSGVSAALLATWLTMDTWQRINITNPPADFGPDTLDQIIAGWTEEFDQVELSVTMNCRPAAAFTVATVESDERLDSNDHFLLHALTTGDTSARVYSSSREVQATYWDHRDGDYKVRISGEDCLVTNTAGLNDQSAPAFVGVGTGASASSGSITPGLPAAMQKGDLMLLLASTRNNGTGTVNTPSGFTPILVNDNQGLFGKVHTGSESAPLVSFTGGAASEDTLAQMCALRNVALLGRAGMSVRLLASSVVTNASAQNVNLPAAVAAARQNAVEIYFGWKKDDVTSVGLLGAPPHRIGVVSSTAGNDACQFWDYRFNTDVASSVVGFWTMTGGASAVSSGSVAVLDGNVQVLTLTRAQNGAVLTHAAGEQVRVKFPIVLALPES